MRRCDFFVLRCFCSIAAVLLCWQTVQAEQNPPGSPELALGQSRLMCTGLQLYWFNAVPGDFNQDGLTDITDLTPLGLHYGKTHPYGQFFFAEELSAVDGDGNGEINNADITVIGQHFGESCLGGYRVYKAPSLSSYPDPLDGPNGPGAILLGQGTSEDVGGANVRQYWQFDLDGSDKDYFYWVRPVDETGEEGVASTYFTWPGGFAPSEEECAPLLSYEAGTSTLKWYSMLYCDYDQNGEVNISDFTVVGMSMLKPGPYEFTSYLSLVDGNRDDTISMGDLDPWVVYFRQSAISFKVLYSPALDDYPAYPTSPDADGVVLADSGFATFGHYLTDRLRYEYVLAAPVAPGYYWVRAYDQYGNPGMPSDWVLVP